MFRTNTEITPRTKTPITSIFFFWLKTLTELWLTLRISRFSTVFRKLLCPFLVFIKKRKKKLKGKENGVWMKESSAGTLYSAKKRKVRELHKRFLGTKISGQCSEPIQKLLPVQRLQTHRLFFFGLKTLTELWPTLRISAVFPKIKL